VLHRRENVHLSDKATNLVCAKNNHSVARQCYTVVRATQQVNGKWQFWGYQNSVTPEAIN